MRLGRTYNPGKYLFCGVKEVKISCNCCCNQGGCNNESAHPCPRMWCHLLVSLWHSFPTRHKPVHNNARSRGFCASAPFRARHSLNSPGITLRAAGPCANSGPPHRRRCSAALCSNTGDGLIIGRRLSISTSAATRLRHPRRCSHAAVITAERLMPATQWISRLPCRTPSDISPMTASNCRAEIGRESAMGTRVYLIRLAL